MPRWKKDAKDFRVSVIERGDKGIQLHLPRPLYEHLGKPDKITFKIEGKKVIVKV